MTSSKDVQAQTGETKAQEDGRIVLEGRGWSVADVAQRFRCTPTRVRRVRLAAGADAATGEQTSVSLERLDERQRAQELAQRGCSQRQIRMFLRCGGSKVERFRPGQRVRHPKYGEGTVYKREGEGEDAKITVQFPQFGLKKLIEKFAQLEKA